MATVAPDLAGTDLQLLTSLVRAVYPHERFPDGPYERSAQALANDATSDARLAAQMRQGLAELTAAGFAEMDAEAKHAYLQSIQATPFFQAVRAAAVVSLYDDREVWELLGYDTDAFASGGWVDRGFDDLDWLPAARIEGPTA